MKSMVQKLRKKREIKLYKVPAHAGILCNEKADKLA